MTEPLIMQRINRRRNPQAFLETAGEDQGLLGLLNNNDDGEVA